MLMRSIIEREGEMATPNSHIHFLSSCFVFLLFVARYGHALQHHHTLQLASLLPSSICTPSAKVEKQRASLEVVHKHGPCSKFSQDKVKPEEILSNDESRIDFIKSKLTFHTSIDGLQGSKATLPAKSGNTIGSGNYIVTIGLGTPKKDLSLIFDTGSDLSWTQCEPCAGSCYRQKDPIFSPTLSTSYSNISCTSAQCSDLFSATRIKPGCSSSTCVYGVQYLDQSFSSGFFGKEKLTLTSTDVIDDFFFGCGQENQGFSGVAGLVGLGRDKLSLVSQAAKKYGKVFSYCLPSTTSYTGYLTFGSSEVSSKTKYTPFSPSRGSSFYFIDIIAIYVGGSKLAISPTVFSKPGTIIDSGTVITRLPPAAYSALSKAFQAQMKIYPMTKPAYLFDTCYDFSNYTTVKIPIVSFVFGGNTMVDIGPQGTLVFVGNNQFCLAFAGNQDASEMGIFGNTQQTTLGVVYDLDGGKLGFAPGGCA